MNKSLWTINTSNHKQLNLICFFNLQVSLEIFVYVRSVSSHGSAMLVVAVTTGTTDDLDLGSKEKKCPEYFFWPANLVKLVVLTKGNGCKLEC